LHPNSLIPLCLCAFAFAAVCYTQLGNEIHKALTVAHVLARLLSTMPQVLTLVPRAISTYTPVLASQQPATLMMHVLEFVPYSGDSRCKCGRPLVLWRQTEALCFTFARGLVRARVLFLRCFQCSAVYGPGLKVNLKHNEHKTHMYVHVDLCDACVHAKALNRLLAH
jgi:hypothetical protein